MMLNFDLCENLMITKNDIERDKEEVRRLKLELRSEQMNLDDIQAIYSVEHTNKPINSINVEEWKQFVQDGIKITSKCTGTLVSLVPVKFADEMVRAFRIYNLYWNIYEEKIKGRKWAAIRWT